jgi:lysyl-tRNA synthetase class 2
VHVESSAIREIEYDRTRRRLQVTFVSGERYVYDRVPPGAHRALIQAESKGRHFQAEIRDRYPYARLN